MPGRLGVEMAVIPEAAASEIFGTTQHARQATINFVQLEIETPVSVKDCNGRLAA
jgi:hypothetical protein